MHEASSNVNINSNFENRNEERRSNNESTTEQVAKISHRIKEDCMEMEFEDITYSVSLGFHKGIYSSNILFLILFLISKLIEDHFWIKKWH